MRSVAIEACVALGFLALALLGGPWFVASALAWGVAIASRALSPRFGGLPGVLFLVVGAVVLASGGAGGLLSLEGAVIGGLVLLQLQRRLTRQSAADDRVSVVVAGLMLVVTAGRTTDVGFLLLAVAWSLAMPLALLPGGRRTSPGSAHLLAGGAVHLLASLAFFVLLPRSGSPADVDGTTKLVGFAPDVELGALDALLDDPTVVFRARVEGGELPERTYWRGLALDGFDGRRWYSSTPPVPTETRSAEGVVVTVEPTGPSDGVLFAPGAVQHVEAGGLRADPQGGWFVPAATSSDPYVLTVTPASRGDAWFSEPRARHDLWLALPALDTRVGELAARVAGNGDPSERAERLRAWLASEVTYTRQGGDHGPRPLSHFLLERREGHCEYVAAGLTVLLRSQGIPARVVNGFLGGEPDPLVGEVVVRRQHAHSWTEALLDGRWVLLDATPPVAAVAPPPTARWSDAAQSAWEGAVVGYDRQAQRARLQQGVTWLRGWLGRPLRAAALVVAVVLGFVGTAVAVRRVWVQRLPGATVRARDGLAAPLQRAEQSLRDAGLVPPPASPPVEVARWLRGRAPDDAVDAFEALAWLHYDVLFGGVSASSSRGRARDLADRVATALDPGASNGSATR